MDSVEFRVWLDRAIYAEGWVRFSARVGIPISTLRLIVGGTRQPSLRLLRKLGVERIITYRVKEKP